MYRIQHFVTKFVSDLQQIGGFLRVLGFSSVNKTDLHDITEILLKVALNTINLFYILATCTSIYFNLSLFYHVLISCVYTMYHIQCRGGSRISSQGGGAHKKIAPSGNFWGISCEKSRFYAKKSYFFQFQGGCAPGAPPAGSAPAMHTYLKKKIQQ